MGGCSTGGDADYWGIGQCSRSSLRVSVIGPGAGTKLNAAVYANLDQREDINLMIKGVSGSPYDRYTQAWGPSGGPPPNLESFACDLLSQGVLETSDCLVFGSRGGQVVLPVFWQKIGEQVPPAVVVNGGVAMRLPIQVPWPSSAVTFQLLLGQDYFRERFTPEQYLENAKSLVPQTNATTAIMLIREGTHMPQTPLLDAILYDMIQAVASWQEDEEVPEEAFAKIISAVSGLGFSGVLCYKHSPGPLWEVEPIGSKKRIVRRDPFM